MAVEVLAFAGGVGGAKLALGLAKVLPPKRLTIVVNTGDDETFHGLHVSPDLDTVMYTLAGLSNPETGWGLTGETFNTLGMLKRYGVDTWFNLGDLDMATHLRRTQLLLQGRTLSEVTVELCQRLGVEHQVSPMSDQPVRTVLSTDAGELAMQEYFVKHRSEPTVKDIRYVGADEASPAVALTDALAEARMVVLCPSNPFLSIGPILAVPGVREGLENFEGPRVAVSPLIGESAFRGPAAKIMVELGKTASSAGVAREYAGIIDYFLIDERDADQSSRITQLGMRPLCAPIIMDSEADKVALAEYVLDVGAG